MFAKQRVGSLWARYALAAACGAVVVLLVAFVWCLSVTPRPDTKTYQAVFLSNGQVYFGKLHGATSRTPVLEDVFYLQQTTAQLQRTENLATTSTQPAVAGQQLALAKLGQTEIHQPQDRLFLVRSQILFWENLSAGSQVIQSINTFKGEQQH